MSGAMAEDDKLDRVLQNIERLAVAMEQDRDAMAMLDRRMESFDANLRGVAQTLQVIVKRQAELEAASEKRRVTCAEMMQNQNDRITAIEQDWTPIPPKFSKEEMDEFRANAGDQRTGNGGGGAVVDFVLAMAENEEKGSK